MTLRLRARIFAATLMASSLQWPLIGKRLREWQWYVERGSAFSGRLLNEALCERMLREAGSRRVLALVVEEPKGAKPQAIAVPEGEPQINVSTWGLA